MIIPQKLNNNTAFGAHLIGNLMFVVALGVLLLLGCNGTADQNNNMTKKDSIPAATKSKTFQELGFFGPIKKDKWNDFIQAVQNNIINSRRESGNMSFSLFQPENGKLQPIWFERFKDKEAHNSHKEQNYFKDAITVIQKSLEGEARSIELKELDEIPAAIPIFSDKPETTRYVIVLFEVRSEKRRSFINAMAKVAPLSRKTRGNLEFNLYQYADDPNKFVLMEGWESVANHETQLKLDHISQLNAATEGLFISNPMGTRWIVKDISR
ncbi:antibiotic biosynthesis monooxygenase [Olivibacter sp. SDN3]|uniref:putative quinol monooxygenase n=1 Tax=Olivibacter sp. SDN3 TaxID=2764720 RepID=UPI00165113D9|nr:antibiotic biosynthesis monooxygenase [Olivibacter sp. SDN3]QNL51846.1 antibiotic biosynthesis monooxygenase [Olivibacter sp. SDN3]